MLESQKAVGRSVTGRKFTGKKKEAPECLRAGCVMGKDE
jgi:hypothetical protein